MSITSAMFTGVSGLLANAEGINVIGNNLANVNTVGFKSGRMLFSDVLSANIGNDSQIGRGTQIQTVDNLFTQGTFETSENVTDLALQGSSFFALKDPNASAPVTQNNALLTRAGAFRVDENLNLVSPDGYQVLDTQGNPIKFTDNAAGITTAIAALTTQLTALQDKTTTLDTAAGALVTAANADLTTATTNFATQLAPLQTKAADLDLSADGLVTAADGAVASAQSDLKTTLSPLQAKAVVLDTKATGLQTAADTAVTTAQQALYNTGVAGESLFDLSELLKSGSLLQTDINALNTAVTGAGSKATAAEIAANTSIQAALTAAQTAVTTATTTVTPENIAAAQQAVSNLTALITNSSGIFIDHSGETPAGADLLTAYAALDPSFVDTAAVDVATDAGALNTALIAQTTADSIKAATGVALTQVNTAYNAVSPTAAQANDAILALNNVSGTIAGSSAVFATIATAEYTTLNTSLTDPPALAGLTTAADTAVASLQNAETQQTAADAIKTLTASAVTTVNSAISAPTVTNAASALTALNTAGTAITSGAGTFTTPSIAAAYNILDSTLNNGPTLASLTTTVNAATTEITSAQIAQASALGLKTSTAAALATATTAATSQNGTDISSALTALGTSSSLIATSAGSFTAANASTAFDALNTMLGSAPDVAALSASVNTASADLTTQQNSAFSKIVKVDTNGLITFLGKDGGIYYYNASGQQGVAATAANAGTVSKLAIISPKDTSALEKSGNSVYKQTANSGVPATAFSLAANSANGTSEIIKSNSLEQSNVDMASQFVKMILTQRAYSANSKTITTADEMTQEVLNLKR